MAAERLPGRYDLAHLRAFHRALFEGLYEWAGELRTVALGKPGALFCLPEHLESCGADVFGRLAREKRLSRAARGGKAAARPESLSSATTRQLCAAPHGDAPLTGSAKTAL